MSKHSPGPWRWSSGYTNGNGEPTWSLIAANGYGILSCDIPNAPQSCNAHDADVLEAAPDLLEACKELLSEAVILSEDYLEYFNDYADDATIQGWDKARWKRALAAAKKAKDAIAKAEGGES